MLYNFLPTTLQLFLTSLLWHSPSTPPSPTLQFQLRHHHALSNTSRVIFSDTNPELAFAVDAFSIPTKPMTVHRPASQALLRSARFRGGNVPWEPSEVYGPDVQDRETLLLLAKMASNAYTEPDKSDWYDISPWNIVSTFLNFAPLIVKRVYGLWSVRGRRGYSRFSASIYANLGMSCPPVRSGRITRILVAFVAPRAAICYSHLGLLRPCPSWSHLLQVLSASDDNFAVHGCSQQLLMGGSTLLCAHICSSVSILSDCSLLFLFSCAMTTTYSCCPLRATHSAGNPMRTVFEVTSSPRPTTPPSSSPSRAPPSCGQLAVGGRRRRKTS